MLHILTIVLDGEPYIEWHLPIFDKLRTPWHWYIVEGQSKPNNDTSWCKNMPSRLSVDGTSEYLDSISKDNRVTVIKRECWFSKTEMVNAACSMMKEDGVLLQVDSDEIWTTENIESILEIFNEKKDVSGMHFRCRYYVGPDIIILDDEPGSKPDPWTRAWRFKPGMLFDKHEPPILAGNKGKFISKEETYNLGLVFDHYSYATRKSVEYKEKFYGYVGAVAGWDLLQKNTEWPTKLKRYLPWTNGNVIADKIRWETSTGLPILAGRHGTNDGPTRPDKRLRDEQDEKCRLIALRKGRLQIPQSSRYRKPI